MPTRQVTSDDVITEFRGDAITCPGDCDQVIRLSALVDGYECPNCGTAMVLDVVHDAEGRDDVRPTPGGDGPKTGTQDPDSPDDGDEGVPDGGYWLPSWWDWMSRPADEIPPGLLALACLVGGGTAVVAGSMRGNTAIASARQAQAAARQHGAAAVNRQLDRQADVQVNGQSVGRVTDLDVSIDQGRADEFQAHERALRHGRGGRR